MRIAFLGFGLIAGSIARALREGVGDGPPGDATHELVAWSPSGAGARAALDDGVVDAVAASPLEAVREADLAILAAPPLAVLDLLDALAGGSSRLAEGLVVTDVASTKARIVERAATLRLPFVGGHPMAGLETSGYEHGRADLFVGRPWVVVDAAPGTRGGTNGPDERHAARISTVEGLARSVGANPIRMDARDHDEAVAAISHLPLVLAAALVEAVVGRGGADERDDWPAAAALAASGWRDMTRLARGDAAMAAGIAATNVGPLVGRLRDLRAVLDDWILELEGEDAAGSGGPDGGILAERFRAARRRLGGEER